MNEQLMNDMRAFILADIENEFGLVSYQRREFAELTARLYNWAEQTDSYSVTHRNGVYLLTRKR